MNIDRYTRRNGLSRSEFSKELANRLCAEAMDTPSVTQIANRVGIPVGTLYHWLRLGSEGDERFADFAIRFQKARGTHHDKYLEHVEAVAKLDDPRAANARLRANEFLLKKHFRGEYADTVKVTGQVGSNNTTFNLKVLSNEQLQTLHTMLKAVRADNSGEEAANVQRLLSEIPIDVEGD